MARQAVSFTPLKLTIDINGVEGTQAMVNAMEKRAINPAPFLKSVAVKDALEGSAERRMERYPFKPVTAAWRVQKRRKGLSPKTMHASERLANALEHTTRDVRLDARNTTLVWGIRRNSDLWMRTHIQASRGRRAVVIDMTAEKNIAGALAQHIAYGYVKRGAASGLASLAAATAIPGIPPPP